MSKMPSTVASLLLAGSMVISAALAAPPVASPLAVKPDPLGAELQRTFISTPNQIADQIRGSFIAYRKIFALAGPPRSAKLHIFADARYLVWLNGRPVHRGPNRFDVRGPQYDTVDVTSDLRAGTNIFAIVVMGNGGPIHTVKDGMGQGHNARMMSHVPGLTLRLDVDGRPVLQTDETWKWSDQTHYRPAKIDWAKIVDIIDTRVEDGEQPHRAHDVRRALGPRSENRPRRPPRPPCRLRLEKSRPGAAHDDVLLPLQADVCRRHRRPRSCPVPVSWKMEKGALRFRIEIPSGVTATLRVPKPGASGTLTFVGKSPPIHEADRFLEADLAEGIHEGRVERSP